MNDVTTEAPNLTESSEGESDWQKVPSKKRRNSASPNIFQQKRPHHDEEPGVSNRYSSLAVDGDRENEANDASNDSGVNATSTGDVQPKPPPIFIPHVDNIDKMISQISKCIESTEFNYKSLKDGQVKLNIKNVESYRKVVTLLQSEGKSYHTFQLKPERAYRVVIKGLHHSTDVSDIKANLLSRGHQVRSVRNIVSRISKIPLPMFYVDVDPGPNNKDIYNIRSIENAIVTIESPRKYDDIVQCFRCQEFGHTRTYCRKPYRCVKCGLDHSSAECNKIPTAPPKCVHCNENHTSSYKGCKYYQNLLNRRTSKTPRANIEPINVTNNLYAQNYTSTNQHNPMSYSQAVRGDENNLLQKIEVMMQKQIELTNTLINMMSMLMSRLCN